MFWKGMTNSAPGFSIKGHSQRLTKTIKRYILQNAFVFLRIFLDQTLRRLLKGELLKSDFNWRGNTWLMARELIIPSVQQLLDCRIRESGVRNQYHTAEIIQNITLIRTGENRKIKYTINNLNNLMINMIFTHWLHEPTSPRMWYHQFI